MKKCFIFLISISLFLFCTSSVLTQTNKPEERATTENKKQKKKDISIESKIRIFRKGPEGQLLLPKNRFKSNVLDSEETTLRDSNKKLNLINGFHWVRISGLGNVTLRSREDQEILRNSYSKRIKVDSPITLPNEKITLIEPKKDSNHWLLKGLFPLLIFLLALFLWKKMS